VRRNIFLVYYHNSEMKLCLASLLMNCKTISFGGDKQMTLTSPEEVDITVAPIL
jgi:hypothetical protein